MSPLAAPARLYQAGVETNKGSAVAATAKLAVPQVIFRQVDNVNRPQLARGLAIRSPGNEFPSIRGTEISIPSFPLNFEQLAWMCECTVLGGVAGAGPTPWVRAYTRSIIADPALKAFTLERRETDFTNHVDHEFAYCMGKSIHISGARDGEVMCEFTGMGNRRENSTLTGALSLPTPVHIPFARSKVYQDASWAALGGTPLAGKVIAWDYTFFSGCKLMRPADNNADLDYDIDVIDGREVGGEVTIRVLMDKTLYEAQLAICEAQTIQAHRIEMAGASSRSIKLDMLTKYVAGSMIEIDEVDGQSVYKMKFQEATDGTNFAAVTIATAAQLSVLGV